MIVFQAKERAGSFDRDLHPPETSKPEGNFKINSISARTALIFSPSRANNTTKFQSTLKKMVKTVTKTTNTSKISTRSILVRKTRINPRGSRRWIRVWSGTFLARRTKGPRPAPNPRKRKGIASYLSVHPKLRARRADTQKRKCNNLNTAIPSTASPKTKSSNQYSCPHSKKYHQKSITPPPSKISTAK